MFQGGELQVGLELVELVVMLGWLIAFDRYFKDMEICHMFFFGEVL